MGMEQRMVQAFMIAIILSCKAKFILNNTYRVPIPIMKVFPPRFPRAARVAEVLRSAERPLVTHKSQ